MTPDSIRTAETDFPGVAEAIPWNDGTGWVVHLADLPRPPVRHGTGYTRFHDFALLHHTNPNHLASDTRVLLHFLTTHARALQLNNDLARAADVFLGNCLNHTYDLTWTSSPDLAIAGDHHSITIEGTALLLAQHPEHHNSLLTQLQAPTPPPGPPARRPAGRIPPATCSTAVTRCFGTSS